MENDTIVIAGEIELENVIDGDQDLESLMDGESQDVLVVTEKDHNRLLNRSLENQHPISAITGLQTALDNKVDRDETVIINCGTSTEVI